jgi:hypothetical protein
VTSRCFRKTHRIALVGAERALVTRLDFVYRGRSAGADRKAPFAAKLPAAGGILRTIATLSDGRRATFDRRLSTCR